MFKWIFILTGALLVFQIGSWMMGAQKPWDAPKEGARKLERYDAKQEVKQEVRRDVREDLQKDLAEPPPDELTIGGWYSLPGEVVKVQFPDGYGFLAEGDFYHEFRIKKLMGKGCLFVDKGGREFLVRFRFNYASNVEPIVQEVPIAPPPVAVFP